MKFAEATKLGRKAFIFWRKSEVKDKTNKTRIILIRNVKKKTKVER